MCHASMNRRTHHVSCIMHHKLRVLPEGTDSTGDANSFASEARNPARLPLGGRVGTGRGPRKLWLVTLFGGKKEEGKREGGRKVGRDERRIEYGVVRSM